MVSGLAMSLAVGNYLQFFPAMEKTSLRIESAEVLPTDRGHYMELAFVVENPTGYSGIAVRAFQASLTFKYPNGTKIAYGSPPNPPMSISPLPPHSTVKILWRAPIPRQTWGGIAEEFQTGKVFASLDASLNVSTFLDNVSWIIISYQCTLEKSPVSCDRGLAAAVSPTGGGGL